MTNSKSLSFNIYRPNKNNQGCASSFNFNKETKKLFLEMARQKPDQDTFDWDNKIIFKLEIADIGEILSVINGRKNGVGQFNTQTKKYKGLYHQSTGRNAVLNFIKKEEMFHIGLSVKYDNKDVTQMYHSLSFGDAEILEILLSDIVSLMHQ